MITGDATHLISVENLHMGYPVPRRIRQYLLHPFAKAERVSALNDVNLSIKKGERVAVLGPNGAGKTSLLKLIGGLILPTKGRLLFKQINVADNLPELRRSVGLVMNEERSFYWRLTGRQNLQFFAALDNLEPVVRDKRIARLVAMVGLEDHIDKRVDAYSSGMKQRLAIARGLLSDPDVLILDEPTRTLDPIAAEQHVELILQRIHNDSDKTLIVATHKLGEAVRLCDRYCIIREGRLLAQTDSESLARANDSLDNFYRSTMGGGHA